MKKHNEYNHTQIEKKWQKEWQATKVYKTEQNSKKKKHYVLDMFPYPSGAGLHVGHPRGYIGSDVYARMKRMQGFNVLHPMGYDAFGLPAEQYAIQHKVHPRKAVDVNVATFEKQLSIIGLSYDWSRKVNTTDPEYYKWTQWIFLKLYDAWYDTTKNKARHIDELISLFEKSGTEKVTAVCDASVVSFSKQDWKAFSPLEKQNILMKYRLAYEGHSEVNWSPSMGTVLANDEVVDGPNGPVSERDGKLVEKKLMRQWFMRITAYAERLLTDLDPLDWNEHIKEIQRNWIGKSDGSIITFALDGLPHKIDTFTTRADTLFGAFAVILAPEHSLVFDLSAHIQNGEEVARYVEEAEKKDDLARTSDDKEKTGVQLKGVYAINPATKEKIPVWIADFVLVQYGTGAIFADMHDTRDFAFAKKYNLPMKNVLIQKGSTAGAVIDLDTPPFTEYGILINSGKFNGMESEEARTKITEFVGGKLVTKYKMRDAVFARQRYWGEPIPLKHDAQGLITEVKEKELPLKLPNVASYEPSGTGESPLASVKSWVKSGYETNTMPGWAGSSWYFLRYMDPENKKVFAGEKALKYWKDIDMYVGGAEHATGHLLYSRFWHKFLYDMGLVPTKEPFKALRNQGMIGGTDGRKMSKRWGNVINPDDVIKTYGADSLRVFEMFLGPFDSHLPWSTEGIIGSRRFIEKVWRLQSKVSAKGKTSPEAEKALHKTIKKVTEDIAGFNFNTAVSSMMICVNEMEKSETIAVSDFKMFLQVLAPFASHVTEDLWHILGEKKSIHISGWPKYNPKKLIEDRIKIGISINGKQRGELVITPDLSEEEIKAEAVKDSKVSPHLVGKEIKRIIYVPGRLVNIVV